MMPILDDTTHGSKRLELFSIKITRVEGDAVSHRFFTAKSARIFAKIACNNKNVVQIDLIGPNETQILYQI